jgi:hypothetical protein
MVLLRVGPNTIPDGGLRLTLDQGKS